MIVLAYDTETSGLTQPQLPDEHPLQPHLVQLGAILFDDAKPDRELASVDLIVEPAGYSIPDGAAKVHGITTARARELGVPLAVAVSAFTNLRAKAQRLVAHNLPFDQLVMRAAIARHGWTPKNPGPSNLVCTMTLAAPVVAIPPTERMKAAGFDKHKPPSLAECIRFFFNEELPGAHAAIVDARACKRVYVEMMRRIAARSAELEKNG